MTLTAD